MEIFWNTIASYNAATWPVQILLTLVAATLTLLLYLRPTPGVRIAMKTFMAMLNFWIAGIYYLLYGEQREHNDMLALFWAIMGCIWVYDLVVKHASLQRTHNHTGFFAALTMTLTSYIPSLEQVVYRVGDSALTSLYSTIHGTIVLPGGMMTRAKLGLARFFCKHKKRDRKSVV